MRTTRTASAVLVGMLAGGGVAVAGAFPAGAVDLLDYRQYQQTLPYSVLSGIGLDEDQETKTTNNTRTGVVGDRNVIPLKPTGGARNIFPALTPILMLSDSLRAQQEFDREDPKPDWIPQDEWDACATSGGDDWTGNFFDGLRDWTASFDGTDCNEVRAGWDREKDPDYEPIGTIGGPAGYPSQFIWTSPYQGSSTLLAPVWGGQPTPNPDDGARVDGWVIPIQNNTQTAPGQNFVVQWLGPGGTVIRTTNIGQISMTGVPGQTQLRQRYPQLCTTSNMCIVPSQLITAAEGTGVQIPPGAMASLHQVGSRQMAPLPYVNPTDGSQPSGELARQVILAWARTESGNVYQCRTVSFVETAPTIPRPCEPEVPPGEVITETGWEVVPETDVGYVPGSNPTRGIQTVTVPDVVRDWQRDNDEETLLLLDLELEGVGSCFDHPEQCPDWWTDPQRDLKYTCTYGGRVVPITECTKYARLFKPGAITSGTPYPQPGTNPSTQPGGQTGTAPAPATQPGSQPSNPEQPRNCFPTGWGIFNPFEWVYKPVRCVLEWAFVPRESVIKGNNNRITNAWRNQSMIRQVVMGVETLIAAIPDEGGCGGIPLDVTLPGGAEIHEQLLYACDGPLAPAAAVTKGILTGSVIFAAFLACTRYIAVIFGFVGYGAVLDMRAAEKAERKGS